MTCEICGGDHSKVLRPLMALQPWRPCVEHLAAQIRALSPPPDAQGGELGAAPHPATLRECPIRGCGRQEGHAGTHRAPRKGDGTP